MVGRGDDDAVDVFAVEDFAKIGIGRAFDRRSRCSITSVFVTIGDGNALGTRVRLGMNSSE